MTAMMFDSTKWPRRDTPWRRAPPKFGIPVGGFLHCIVFLGIARDVLILVSRSLLCSGSCHCSPQQTRFFFEKSADRRTHRALIRRTVCRGEILGVFWPVLGAEKHGKDTTTRTFRKEKTVKIEEKIPKNQKQIKLQSVPPSLA